jgi:type IV pilus assembly protein PilC
MRPVVTITSQAATHPPSETGDVDGMLTKIAGFYESEVDAAVKALTLIIEPLMIVVVGGIIIVMYLPMFKIFELVQ